MKNRIGLILMLLLTVYPTIYAQNTELIGDTVELSVNGYKEGQIQWQISNDSVKWSDLVGAINRNLKYKIIDKTYFRAKITVGKCYYISNITPIKAYYNNIKNIFFSSYRNDSIYLTWTDPTAPDFIGVKIKNLRDSNIINIEKGKQNCYILFKSPYDSISFSIQPLFSIQKNIKDTTLKIDNYSVYFSRKNQYSAHRGYSSIYPENTILAFTKAAEVGFNYVECDIRLTKDNIWVVCHDDSINRVSDGKGTLSTMTYSELLKYNFGCPKMYNNKYNVAVASYVDFLKTCQSLNIYPIIEIKIDINDKQAQDLINLTLNYLKPYNFCFHSFNYHALQEIRKFDKKIILGYLTNTFIDSDLNLVNSIYPSTYNVAYNGFFVGKNLDLVKLNSMTTSFSQIGIYILVWTVNDLNLANQFLSRKIKNIITENKLF